MDAYTLKKHKETGELHLFKGVMQPNKADYPCTSNKVSICEEMNKSDSESNKFTCCDESEARKKCAEFGRSVCGTCVSHLYETY
ncbi:MULTISPECIES: hypothetical protein [unclassified Chromohalobacter]|uniref:hypothetical protein n=1 Tax=unclassified Chromohalobacter TaxID=2628571 RepID=UPI00246909E1|nr:MULTISPECIES: hypothetical protein [unclassified Chromohalobacter]